MAITKTIGGDKIGAGKKMQTEIEGYSRANFDLSRIFRTSAAPGTLIPCFTELAQKGDNWYFNVRSLVRTIPTRGPLFGTFTLDIHFFICPLRLQIGAFHNDAIDIGNNMEQILYPTIDVPVKTGTMGGAQQLQKQSMNQSALLAYLGIRNPGHSAQTNYKYIYRRFNGIGTLNYMEIFKRYYANKQETNAYFIGSEGVYNGPFEITAAPTNSVNTTTIYSNPQDYQNPEEPNNIKISPNPWGIWTGSQNNPNVASFQMYYKMGKVEYTKEEIIQIATGEGVGTGLIRAITISTAQPKEPKNITFTNVMKENSTGLGPIITVVDAATYIEGENAIIGFKIHTDSLQASIENFLSTNEPGWTATSADYFTAGPFGAMDGIQLKTLYVNAISGGQTLGLIPFPLKNIDEARWKVLKNCLPGENVQIKSTGYGTTNPNEASKVIDFYPYSNLSDVEMGVPKNTNSQFGLVVKTYKNDIYQNWLDSATIQSINEKTGVAVLNGQFQIGNLILAEKAYKQKNKIAVSGGTYEDWEEAVYGISAERMCESPMFIGGASVQIDFDEVVSTSETTNADGSVNPLGTLGGRGNINPNTWKGGNFECKITEDSMIMGIMSITPNIDYSQGNWWFNKLQNNDQLHKPEFDQIGFQQLISDQFAGFDTAVDGTQTSAGWGIPLSYAMQPAWEHYMTAINQAYGDFADEDKAMWMTLNRRYEAKYDTQGNYQKVKDFTAYIDPTKFNYAFADTNIESQNFWVQIAIDAKARRKMSNKVMPNL